MSFEVRTTSVFEKEAKALAKRYRSFKNDLAKFIEELKEEPLQGDELTPGLRKIRMAIASKGRGKSGGARVITYNLITARKNGKIYLMEIYDKSEFTSVDVNVLVRRIAELETNQNA